MPAPVLIRPVGPEDWAAIRDIRLRMLADSPLAYGETLADAEQHSEREWRVRGLRGQGASTTSLVAITHSGEWVSMMGGYVDPRRGALLIGVFVDTAWRGRTLGVADAMLDAVIEWARGHGDTLTLDVHEANDRAIAFYRRRGFQPTGNTLPYPLDPTALELELRLEL